MVPPDSVELLKGATLDFVELEPGQFNFIFMNPNDPEYVPPKESQDGSHRL
jgi:iron-sulfur cluster assembly protein